MAQYRLLNIYGIIKKQQRQQTFGFCCFATIFLKKKMLFGVVSLLCFLGWWETWKLADIWGYHKLSYCRFQESILLHFTGGSFFVKLCITPKRAGNLITCQIHNEWVVTLQRLNLPDYLCLWRRLRYPVFCWGQGWSVCRSTWWCCKRNERTRRRRVTFTTFKTIWKVANYFGKLPPRGGLGKATKSNKTFRVAKLPASSCSNSFDIHQQKVKFFHLIAGPHKWSLKFRQDMGLGACWVRILLLSEDLFQDG